MATWSCIARAALPASRARIASAILRWPRSESVGRFGWASDAIRVSLIKSLISAMRVASGCHRSMEPFVPLDASAPGGDVSLHELQGLVHGGQIALGPSLGGERR